MILCKWSYDQSIMDTLDSCKDIKKEKQNIRSDIHKKNQSTRSIIVYFFGHTYELKSCINVVLSAIMHIFQVDLQLQPNVYYWELGWSFV